MISNPPLTHHILQKLDSAEFYHYPVQQVYLIEPEIWYVFAVSHAVSLI
jgi:hypothetical protein